MHQAGRRRLYCCTGRYRPSAVGESPTELRRSRLRNRNRCVPGHVLPPRFSRLGRGIVPRRETTALFFPGSAALRNFIGHCCCLALRRFYPRINNATISPRFTVQGFSSRRLPSRLDPRLVPIPSEFFSASSQFVFVSGSRVNRLLLGGDSRSPSD